MRKSSRPRVYRVKWECTVQPRRAICCFVRQFGYRLLLPSSLNDFCICVTETASFRYHVCETTDQFLLPLSTRLGRCALFAMIALLALFT